MSKSAFDIFSDVVELDPAGRAAAVRAACQNDPELRAEVESLLRAHDTAAGSFLEGPALPKATEEIMAATTGNRAGETIGPYRLVQAVGIGGMGSVWLAERVDGEFEQHVAIKFIRHGMDSDDMVHRFRRERQVLAGLQHPNIARLIDGGTTDTGLPYLLMEYVDGRRIDHWCDERSLTIEQRIRLFLEVCAAVQHAHRNLVVHRDLKPSNILVTPDGIPKLLDFGIAKLLSSDARLVDPTRTGHHRMTPAYASPEQVRGEAMTTASDVYSLGVILYELLTGRPPYEFESSLAQEAEQVICHTPPHRPRVALTTSATSRLEEDMTAPSSGEEIARRRSTDLTTLRRRLSGDLEKILLMALRKEPTRRYASIEPFSEDLRRYLAGMPISAQPDTMSYRARRFVGRHRVGVAAAALVAITLAAATATSTAMYLHASTESERAEDEAAAATTVSSFLRDMIASIDPAIAQGRDVSLFRDMLDATAERLDQADVGSDRVRAELLLTVGRAYHAIGEYATSEELLGQAVLLQRAMLDDSPELADALMAWGRSLRELARYDDALAALREALAVRREAQSVDEALIGKTLASIGTAEWASGDYDAGEESLRRAVSILRQYGGEHSTSLATALLELGGLLSDHRRQEEAEPMLLEAKEILLAEYGELHPTVAQLEVRLGWCARRGGRLEEAAQYYRRALHLHEQLHDPDHPSIGYNLTGLAAVLEDLERYVEAESLYLRALEIGRSALGPHHVELGTIHNNLGGLYRKLGQYDEAADHLNQAIEIYSTVRGPRDVWTSFPWLHLANVYIQSGMPDEALHAAEQCLSIRMEHLPADHADLHAAHIVRASALVANGRLDEAEPILLERLDALQSRVNDGHPLLALAREGLAAIHVANEAASGGELGP